MACIRIGIVPLGQVGWHAGTVYMFNLLSALRESYSHDIELIIMLAGPDCQVDKQLREMADGLLTHHALERWTLRWLVNGIFRRIFRWDFFAGMDLKRHGIQVVAFGRSPARSGIPQLLWLPDFQHIYLPEMFSPQEYRKRNEDFLQIASDASRLILLSHAVKRDLEKFSPQFAHKARVVPPVAAIPASTYDVNSDVVRTVYHLPNKFVYLPNQYWKHKNHSTVFRAMRTLRDRGIEVFLVLSGYPGDYRHSAYFSELLQSISQLGIREQIAHLGLIPRDHVFQLIRQSVCVINPSLFEGFGMTADEARSIGKRVILSDIPAHREQSPPGSLFFDPLDCEGLASLLEQIWNEALPGPDFSMEAEARNSLLARRRKSAESLMSVILESIRA
jgi:glycosyltransferase involved in cell wall biosynthesis